MTKKTVLLITDDHKTEVSVKEALGRKYELEIARSGKKADELLVRTSPDLVVVDFDLKGEDGLRVFRGLRTSARAVMLSASGSIPLAVSAAKSGVEEFFRKPLDLEQFRDWVDKNIGQAQLKLRWSDDIAWLKGNSPALKNMFNLVQKVIKDGRDIVLVGEAGTPKAAVAEFIHKNSPRRQKRFVRIDAASFRREASESLFWAAVQEFMSLPETSSMQGEEDRCGTLYLENVESLDEHFRLSIFNYFQERRGKVDKSLRVIIGLGGRTSLADLKDQGYAVVGIPPLSERKEDLPYMLEYYLKRASEKYGRDVRYVSTAVLDFFASYDFPGNYQELERLIEGAVFAAAADKLDLADLPLDYKGLLQTSLKRSLNGNLTLEEAKKSFEKKLLGVLLNKSGDESSRVARFLDIPKSVLSERLENLLD